MMMACEGVNKGLTLVSKAYVQWCHSTWSILVAWWCFTPFAANPNTSMMSPAVMWVTAELAWTPARNLHQSAGNHLVRMLWEYISLMRDGRMEIKIYSEPRVHGSWFMRKWRNFRFLYVTKQHAAVAAEERKALLSSCPKRCYLSKQWPYEAPKRQNQKSINKRRPTAFNSKQKHRWFKTF